MCSLSYSQSLINLLLTGKAVSNVWDNDKDVEGLSESVTINLKPQNVDNRSGIM